MKVALFLGGRIGGFLLFMAVLIGASYAWSWYTAEPAGQLQARREIKSGSNRIAQYNMFYNSCASVQALEQQISNFETALRTETNPDRVARLNDNLLGVKGLRAQAITQYNADASKSYTNGQFRDSDLPYTLKMEGKTTCDVYSD